MMMAAIFTIDSCKKSNPAPLDLGTLMVGTIDLNAASAPTNVPVNPTITATFTTDVDETTATSSNITLTEDYDAVSIPLTISVSGRLLILHPPTWPMGQFINLSVTSG